MPSGNSKTAGNDKLNFPEPIKGLTRIIFVTNTAFNIYLFRRPIIEGLLAAGYEVFCVAPIDRHADKLISLGLNYISIPLSGHGRGIIEQLKSVRALLSVYRDINPDFIFHYSIKPNIYGTIAAWWNNIPSVAIVTGLGALVDLNNSPSAYLVRTTYAWAVRHSREVWFLNDHDLGYFQKLRWLNHTPYRMLPSEGVQLDEYPVRPLRHRKGSLRILYAGRILKAKGLEVLAKASELLQERGASVSIGILGFMDLENPDAIPLSQFDSWIKRGLMVYYGGSEDVPHYLEQTDVVILPSFREGKSRILLEALATGRPVITTDVPGCRELVEHGCNGLICPVDDPQALANACEYLANIRHDTLQAMGGEGRKLVESSHGIPKIAGIYADFLREMINNISDTKNNK